MNVSVKESGIYETGRETKRKCSAIKDLIIEGDIEQAKCKLGEVCPDLLANSHIHFLLKKQMLVEKLRGRTNQNDQDAIRWIREELAPSAADAHPSSYDDFKKLLLVLMFDESAKQSPVNYEWSEEPRKYLGELIYSTLKSVLGFKDPDLVNLLKYLLLNLGHQSRDIILGEIKDDPLLGKIYLSDRMPPPMTLEDEANVDISPKDVDTLVIALEISSSDAVRALTRSKGDVAAAFESELGRLKLDVNGLDTLVLEYAGYRGLLQLSESESEEFDDVKSENDMMDVDDKDWHAKSGVARCLSEADKPRYPVRKLSRLSYKHDPNLKIVLRLLKKVREGKYLETIEQVKEIDEEIYKKYPQVLFELWRLEVIRVAGNGNYETALELLRRNLTPIVKRNDELVPSLKETLTMIMSQKAEAPSTAILCLSLQTALQESLKLPGPKLVSFLKGLLDGHCAWVKAMNFQDIFSKNLGIDVLSSNHSSEIHLISPPAAVVSHEDGAPRAEHNANIGFLNYGLVLEAILWCVESDRSLSMGWGSVTSEESVVELSETVITQVMEMLNLPRAHVIDLLRQHEGNADLAVLHVMQHSEDQ